MIRYAFCTILAVWVLALPLRADVAIQQVTSPGGISAWLVTEPGIPFTALEIRFQGGQSLDAPGKRGAIIYALAGLKNVGAGAVATIVAERVRGGPFKSLADFASRFDPKALNKRALEMMAMSGAFDVFEKNRALVHGKKKEVLAEMNMGSAVYGTITPANGAIILNNRNQLFSISAK